MKEPSEGSGAFNAKLGKRNVNKPDWADAVVKHFFPNEPESEWARMRDAIMGKKVKPRMTGATTVLECFKARDPEDANMPIFQNMKEAAQQQEKANAAAPRTHVL